MSEYYTFTLSENVNRTSVSYLNRYGIRIAADLYTAKDMDETEKHPALVIGPPYGGVKEQGPGVYANQLAQRGFVCLAFDPAFMGESGGEPRHVSSPDIFAENFSAGVDYLGTLPFVDREQIGAIGICGSGGFALSAAQVDTRIKSSFNNIEQQSLEFVKYTLDPWVSRWEQAMVRALLTPDEKKKYFFKFNVDGLLRGDYQSRMNGYATARQNGWMSANDIRELENLDRIPAEQGGDLYLINGNMTKLEDAGIFAAGNNGKEEGDSDEEVLELEKQEDQRPGFRRRGQ